LGDYSIFHGNKQEGELPAGHAMVRVSTLRVHACTPP
jgi:hypothetical protein